MTNRKLRKQIRKMAISHYNKMMSEARNIAKDYKIERVPIFYIKQIIERGKLKEPFDNPDLENFRKNFNKVQDKLKEVCIKNSNQIKDDAIALNHFKLFIDEVKSAFLKGVDSAKDVENERA